MEQVILNDFNNQSSDLNTNLSTLKEKIGEEFDLDKALDLVHRDEEVIKILKRMFHNVKSISKDDLNAKVNDESILELILVYLNENNIVVEEKEVFKDTIHFKDDILNDYYQQIAQYKILSPAEEKDLFSKIKYTQDPELKEMYKQDAIHHNLRWAFKMGLQYRGQATSAHDTMDLVMEANLGLMRAVEDFDVDRGYKFSTYSSWWIRQAITRSIADKSRAIRQPVHMVDALKKYVKIKFQLEMQRGRELTIEELAEAFDVTTKKIEDWEKQLINPVSIDTPVGEDLDTPLRELLADDSPSTDAIALQSMVRPVIESELFSALTEREQKVLRLRFGFDNGVPLTLEQVGQMFGVTRERIRQIETKALRKLRTKDRRKRVADMLDIYNENDYSR